MLSPGGRGEYVDGGQLLEVTFLDSENPLCSKSPGEAKALAIWKESLEGSVVIINRQGTDLPSLEERCERCVVAAGEGFVATMLPGFRKDDLERPAL